MDTNELIQQKKIALQEEFDELNKLEQQGKVDAMSFAYGDTDADNLIKWQLEVNDIIDTLYHMLRGDKIVIKEGQRIWEAISKEKMPVSEEGVNDIIREVFVYINKNLLLSYYDSKEIAERIYAFGDYFADLVMNSYELLGLDNEEKQERYSLIVLSTVNAVNSAYNRALGGKERESLTKKTMVHQSLTPHLGQATQQKGGFSLNPLKWFKH